MKNIILPLIIFATIFTQPMLGMNGQDKRPFTVVIHGNGIGNNVVITKTMLGHICYAKNEDPRHRFAQTEVFVLQNNKPTFISTLLDLPDKYQILLEKGKWIYSYLPTANQADSQKIAIVLGTLDSKYASYLEFGDLENLIQ